MNEEQAMMRQQEKKTIVNISSIPYSIISDDIPLRQRTMYYAEMEEISKYYRIYEYGNDFVAEGAKNYIPSDLHYKKASNILNKEARFCFASPPDFTVEEQDDNGSDESQLSVLQEFLDAVLKKGNFNSKLIKAAKDCFIGKRVALVINFNDKSGITLTFLNAFEFVFDLGEDEEISLFVSVSKIREGLLKEDQAWLKKKYVREDDKVYLEETLFDGLGKEIEKVTKRTPINLKYIPAVIIFNDGLTGDRNGKSELSYLADYESVYSKMSNADIDSMRKNLNPVRYTVDASNSSTTDLSIAPGAYWDIQSDVEMSENHQAKVGVLESGMNFSEPLKKTLDRIENTMYSEVDVPNVDSENLQGVITSGKTLKALYWGLTVRCDEKMLAWIPALEFAARTVIDGALSYPGTIARYTTLSTLPRLAYKVTVINNYPLPEDVEEEKALDLQEVDAKVMSRKTYLKKWGKMSARKADEELEQIKFEMDLFENSQSILPPSSGLALGTAQGSKDSEGENIRQGGENASARPAQDSVNVLEWGA